MHSPICVYIHCAFNVASALPCEVRKCESVCWPNRLLKLLHLIGGTGTQLLDSDIYSLRFFFFSLFFGFVVLIRAS
ncbi:unnamed protein product [Coffea canephora]|uniref:Uncharacterized protein n=1 Tax=Coffea canephora TaxID=49390 RepID=A0A068U374_COFCA|nr:unnamed protein product [Coffea canephora]